MRGGAVQAIPGTGGGERAVNAAPPGAVTITYSEPAGCSVKFRWTTTIALDGSSVTTPVVAG